MDSQMASLTFGVKSLQVSFIEVCANYEIESTTLRPKSALSPKTKGEFITWLDGFIRDCTRMLQKWPDDRWFVLHPNRDNYMGRKECLENLIKKATALHSFLEEKMKPAKNNSYADSY